MAEEIHIALIEHRYGTNYYASKRENAVRDAVDEYVKEWWASEFGEEPMPEDRDDRIEDYFDRMAMAGREEFLSMETAELIE